METTIESRNKSTNGARNGATAKRKLQIVRATMDEMHVAAKIVTSTAHWYQPFLNEKDMAEHLVDEKWARRNFTIREFFFGREDDKIVGIISMQHAGDYIYLGYAYLMENAVGRGYGGQLLQFAKEKAMARDYRGMVLIAHPEAKWAVKAYEKFGFKKQLQERQDVLNWNEGFLKPYYEDGFHLFKLDF